MKIEKKVADFIESMGVKIHATHIGLVLSDEWANDAFIVEIKRNKVSRLFDYKMGIGHRKLTKNGAIKLRDSRYDGRREAALREILLDSNYSTITPPTAASVLHSLLLDAQSTGETFENWALCYGYDADSRKAEAIYHACLENSRKISAIFSASEMESLDDMLRDY